MGFYEKEFEMQLVDIGDSNRLSMHAILKYLQEIASVHSGMVGYGVNDIERTHLAWILLNWKLEIWEKPSWGHSLKIKTWPRLTEKFYSCRDFEIYCDDKQIGIASSKWIIFDTAKNRIGKITDEMAKEYDCVDRCVFSVPIHEKLEEPENSIATFHYTIGRRDIDTNHHTNNICYLDFAYEALPEEVYKNNDFKNVEIMYKRQSKLGYPIVCYYAQASDTEHVVTIKSEDNSLLHAIVKLY